MHKIRVEANGDSEIREIRRRGGNGTTTTTVEEDGDGAASTSTEAAGGSRAAVRAAATSRASCGRSTGCSTRGLRAATAAR